MGIEAKQLELMRKYIPPSSDILCLGYADMLLQASPVEEAPEVPNSDEIRKWHGWNGPVYDTRFVFRKLGWKPTFIDFKAGPNIDEVVDLNEPPRWLQHFDAVFDPGTLEHVFSIGAAWKWVYERLRLNGHIIHVSPVNAINHGLWSIQPGTYKDLYGSGLLEHYLMYGPKNARQHIDIKDGPHVHARFASQPELWNVVAAKVSEEFKWPTQHKYK